MKDSSIISALKSYILLVGVAAASVILMVVFFIQKNGSDTNIFSDKNSASVSETTADLHQPATFESETTENSTDIQPMTDISEPGTVPSEPAEKTFTQADDSYFHDALFIGNSRTVGLYLYGSMPEETTFYATVGMNIYDLLDSTAQVPPEEGPEQSFDSLLSSRQFGKIYIMLGINDLGTGTSESFAEYYKSIVDHIHEIQPNAIIYIQSIINISAARDAQGDAVSNANIIEKNALLRKLENKDYIFYLDINEVLSDENGFLNSDYTSDGIHLGGGSVSIWEDYLYSHAIAVQ